MFVSYFPSRQAALKVTELRRAAGYKWIFPSENCSDRKFLTGFAPGAGKAVIHLSWF